MRIRTSKDRDLERLMDRLISMAYWDKFQGRRRPFDKTPGALIEQFTSDEEKEMLKTLKSDDLSDPLISKDQLSFGEK